MVCRLVTRQGIPQTEVARQLGISRAAIYRAHQPQARLLRRRDLSPELSTMIDRWALSVMGEEEGAITICDLCRCAAKKF